MTNSNNIYLYVPNIIGYIRILSGLLGLYFLPTDPLYAMSLYGFSCILDAVDGYAARSLGQSSKFGAVLDMVIDRCSTTSLLVFLGLHYPSFLLLFQCLISLDLSSHYAHMVASLTLGSSSHKKVTEKTPRLLRLYYQNSTVLFLVCAGNELFFMFLYLYGWFPKSLVVFGVGLVALPVCVFKQILNVIQLVGASQDLVHADTHKIK